jgi:3-methylcrotonyl-CoA carboxylase alpha subunit
MTEDSRGAGEKSVFRSVLIANRGEIACRIIKTARRLGLRTIAVYSEVDANALHVRLADEAHWIGAAPAAESYLNQTAILAVAQSAAAECLHPGYGFLAENAEFAQACADAGVVFVGPPPSAIRAMGLKDQAKALMQKIGVPVVPGYHGSRQEPVFLREKAYEIGYPVLIKAVAGGGGKGMRRVDAHAEFEAALESAQREAKSAFGNSQVLVEKFIAQPRHIEMQIFADRFGDVIHLFERDCSLQRRHQKVIEEAPAPLMSEAVRERMAAAAIAAAKGVGYVGAGTVEFIADGRHGLRPDGFYFMEMNTRLQVEHPVTEAVTGIDLVELQLRVAAGEKVSSKTVILSGHAVEARLYAEDPDRDFLPSSGTVFGLRLPEGEGVRVDSAIVATDSVSPFYDPLIAKIIAHGSDRNQALDRLAAALHNTVVVGPTTNRAFLQALIETPDYRAQRFDTRFIAAHRQAWHAADRRDGVAIGAGVSYLLSRRALTAAGWDDPWNVADAFELGAERHTNVPILVEDEAITAVLIGGLERAPIATALQIAVPALGYGGSERVPITDRVPAYDGHNCLVLATDETCFVWHRGRQTRLRLVDSLNQRAQADSDSDGAVRAPMHGKLVQLLVKPGDAVRRGTRLAILEAMKMEHTLLAPFAGTVADVSATEGMQVEQSAQLMVIAEDGDAPSR